MWTASRILQCDINNRNMLSYKVAFLAFGILSATTQICGIDLYEGSACDMKSGKRGVCTILQQCKSIDSALKAKTFPLRDLVTCSFVGDTEVICCPDKLNPSLNTEVDEYIFPKNDKPDAKSRTSQRKADRVCEQFITNYFNLPKPVDFHILDGDPTYLGEFPHMAAIGFPVSAAGQTTVDFRCGGSLISNQYVMTAAHCVDRPNFLPTIIRLGTIYLNEDSENARDFGVQSVILHPNYKTSLKYHDIALIRLNSTVPLTSRIIFPACLDTDTTDIEPNSELIATGWGFTNVTTRRKSDILLKVALTTVMLPTCDLKHREHARDKRLPHGLLDGQMCAYDPNLKGDTCEGDSGGPLQIKSNAQVAKVIGITSFGLVCGSPLPPVYTRVSFYLDWLEEVVWPNQV